MQTSISQFQALEAMFTKARHMPPAERSAFLAEVNKKDSAMVSMLLELLAVYEADESLNHYGGEIEAIIRPPTISLGDQFGSYCVERYLGEGGMGQVFLAHRTDGFERQVAIKFLKVPHLVADSFYKSSEREILSRLDHPYIAKLFDVGETSTGHAFVVMEYVDGIPIDAYCQFHRLDLQARLEIFAKVCQALAFAQQHQVIHLDLKPANILITKDGTPKILDFGLAVVLGQTQDAGFHSHQLFLTPDFASPEQVMGHAVGPQSDLFSLGNLLYRIVTGRKPYETANQSFDRLKDLLQESHFRLLPMREAIELFPKYLCPQDTFWPVNPRDINGELEAMVAKAMSVSLQQRYPHVKQLLLDLNAYQNNEPTSPRSPGEKRSHWLTGSRAKALGWILGFLGILSSFFLINYGLRQREPDQVPKQDTFQLLEKLVDQSRKYEGHGEHPTAKAIFLEALNLVGQDPLEDARQQALLLETLAKVSMNLGDYTTAECLLKEVIDLRSGQMPADLESLSQTMEHLGQVYWHAGDLDLGELWVTRGLELRQELIPQAQHLVHESYQSLAVIFELQDRLDEAEWILTTILGQMKPELWDGTLATTLNNMALVARKRGDYQPAIALISETLAINQQSMGPNHPVLAKNLNNLGLFHKRNGDLEEALIFYEKALEIQRKSLPEDHPYLGLGMNNMATLLQGKGDLQQAETYYRQALKNLEKSLSPNHPSYLRTLNNFASLSYANGQYAEAQKIFEKLLRLERESTKPNPGNLSQTLNNLGMTYKARGHLALAHTMIAESLAIRRKHLGNDHPLLIPNLFNLGRINHGSGRCIQARKDLLDVQRILELRSKKSSTRLAVTHVVLAQLDMEAGRLPEAWSHLEKAEQMLEGLVKEEHRYRLEAKMARVEWFLRDGQKEKAKVLLDQILPPIVDAVPLQHSLARKAISFARCL